MPMLADLVELARRGRHPQDIHTAAVVQAASGAVVDQLTVPATPAGYRRPSARRPIRRLAGVGDREPRRRWRRPDPVPAGSGRAGGGGAGPAKRAARRHGAKSDPWSDQGGHRRQRQLHALVVAARGPLRGRLGNLTTPRLVVTCGRLRQQATGDVETAATTAATLGSLARRIHLLNPEVADHTRASSALVRTWRTGPVQPLRVGPIVAAIVCAPGPILAAAGPMPPSPCWAAPPRSRPPAARRCGCG
jgi:transposase